MIALYARCESSGKMKSRARAAAFDWSGKKDTVERGRRMTRKKIIAILCAWGVVCASFILFTHIIQPRQRYAHA